MKVLYRNLFVIKSFKGATIVVGTTGRLNQFIQDGTISLDKVRFLILDEADRMLDMGFGEDITRITQHATIPDKKARQTLMFRYILHHDCGYLLNLAVQRSLQTCRRPPAYSLKTITSWLQLIRSERLTNVCWTTNFPSFSRLGITQEIIKCDQSQKKDKLLELLNIDIEKYTVDKSKLLLFQSTTLSRIRRIQQEDTHFCIEEVVCRYTWSHCQ